MRVIIVTAAAWYPERQATLDRLRAQVPDAVVLASRRKEHSSVWARRAWEIAEEWDEPVAILNDDVTTCPDFSAECDRMVAAVPGRTISLHTSLPQALQMPGSWLRTYWMTGPGYILPAGVPKQLLDYWATLPRMFGPNEDNVAIQWARERQEPFWSCIPAIVKHDTSTKSTLGYDNHPMRTCSVSWEDRPGPIDWTKDADAPPFVENPWAPSTHLEQVRQALASGRPCSMCWTRHAAVGKAGTDVCGPCLAQLTTPLFNAMRGG